MFWLIDGDFNSKFFRAYATTRKKLNHVTHLKSDNGNVVTNHEDMCQVVHEYFTKLFHHTGREADLVLDTNEAVILEEQNNELVANFTFHEFTVAIKRMHPDKSSCPDERNPTFFQNFWSLLGNDIFQCCKDWISKLAP